MSSDSFINLSKVKSILPSFTFRQTAQGDRTLFRTSSNLFATGSSESFQAAGYTPSPGDSPPATQPQTINVVLFGETGVGKSSVINLIARKEIAKVSSDVNGCTMQSTRHDISFDDMNFAIFDTIGLEEPQMGVNGYLKAIAKAYELVVRLGAAGGIHLLLFCMRGGRITATTQSNYRLFCECLCSTKVPIALVFTGLERETEMEDWWTRNRTHIEHYGIKSDGHACITAVQDDTPGEDLKYTESQNKIRELLRSCALKNEAFLPEPHSWFAKIGRGMRSFIEKHKNPKRRDVMKVLTHRCKLDPETARKIADMMEKGDTEMKDENKDEHMGNTEGEGQPNPEVRADGKNEREMTKENAANDDAPPNQLGDVKAEHHDEATGGRDERKAPKKSVAKDHAPPNQPSDVKAEHHDEGMGGKGEKKVPKEILAKDHAPPNRPGDVKAELYERMEGKDERKAPKRSAARDHALLNQPGDVKAEHPDEGVGGKDERKAPKKNMMKDHSPSNQQVDFEAERRTYATDGRDERDVGKKNQHAPSNQPGDIKAELRTDGRRHKYGGGGDQSLGVDAAEQVKQGDIKRRLGSSAPPLPRHVTGSQS